MSLYSEVILYDRLDFLKDETNNLFKEIYIKSKDEYEAVKTYDEVYVLLGYLNSKDYGSYQNHLRALLPYLAKWGFNMAIIFAIYVPLKLKLPCCLFSNCNALSRQNFKKNYVSREELNRIVSCFNEVMKLDDLFDCFKREYAYIGNPEVLFTLWTLCYDQKAITFKQFVDLINIMLQDESITFYTKMFFLKQLFTIDDKFYSHSFPLIKERTFKVENFSPVASKLKEYEDALLEVDDGSKNADFGYIANILAMVLAGIKNPILDSGDIKETLSLGATMYQERLKMKGDCRFKQIPRDISKETELKILFNKLYENYEFDALKDEDDRYCDCEDNVTD